MKRTHNESSIRYLYQFDTDIAACDGDHLLALRALRDPHHAFALEFHDKIYSPIINHRGDICALIQENSSPTTYRYSAFGEFLHEGQLDSPWLFSGQRYDQETALYHYAKRQYDPTLGIWVTPDPLGFADGPNLYAYVKNNPFTYVDPYGLFAESVSMYASRQARFLADRISNGARDAIKRLPLVRSFASSKKKAAGMIHATADFALDTVHGVESAAFAMGSANLEMNPNEQAGISTAHHGIREQRRATIDRFFYDR